MKEPEPSPDVLSPRERQVVALLAQGLRMGDLADLLCMSRKAIDDLRQSAYHKLDIHDRVILRRWAIRHGVDASTPLAPDPSPQASSNAPEPADPT